MQRATKERFLKECCRGYLRRCVRTIEVVRSPNTTTDPNQTGRLVALMIWARAVRGLKAYNICNGPKYIASELRKLYTAIERMDEVTLGLGLEAKRISLMSEVRLTVGKLKRPQQRDCYAYPYV